MVNIPRLVTVLAMAVATIAMGGGQPANAVEPDGIRPPAAAGTRTGEDRDVLPAKTEAATIPVYHFNANDTVPAQYGDFVLSTQHVTPSNVTVGSGFSRTDVRAADGTTEQWYAPTVKGATITIGHVGQWTDPNNDKRWIDMRFTVNDWRRGEFVVTPRGYFGLNAGRWDDGTTDRSFIDVTIDFTLDDGTTPQGLRGVTGFTDLDGETNADGTPRHPDGIGEGWELLSGFDGAWVRSDTHLKEFGQNGWAGAGDANTNVDDEHGMQHYLGATFTGSTLRAVYSVPPASMRGSGFMPLAATLAFRLTYDANGGTGRVPSNTTANGTQPAAATTFGTVRPIAGETGHTTRAENADAIGTVPDGTGQQATTHADGSVSVSTMADDGTIDGCQVYYPAGARITLATAAKDADCWDSTQLSKTARTWQGWSETRTEDTMDRSTLQTAAATVITMPDGPKTVYALWAIDPTLNYVVNNPADTTAPDPPASRTVPWGTAAPDDSGWKTGDGERIPGWRFDGWYTAAQGGTQYDFKTPLTGNVTVYAHWTGEPAALQYRNDWPGGTGETPDTNGRNGQRVTVRDNGFIRPGYTFTGWATDKRVDPSIQPGDPYTLKAGTTILWAQWKADAAHLVYDANMGAGSPTRTVDGMVDQTVKTIDNPFARPGWRFDGWNTKPDGTGTSYAPDTNFTLRANDATNPRNTSWLYAQWTPETTMLPLTGGPGARTWVGMGLVLLAMAFGTLAMIRRRAA